LFEQLEFFTTVNDLERLPDSGVPEIAFAGRSNAGKSSAINTLANRKRLAFVSKTPGRTQHINFFKIAKAGFLVDLPGYGYAKVPAAMRRHWEQLLSRYLQTRVPLQGMVMIMDIRHPLTDLDMQMLDWFHVTGKPVHILLTKADKLSNQHAGAALRKTQGTLKLSYPEVTVQLFSSSTRQGMNEARKHIEGWLQKDTPG
jgi:GTP-binding protein